MNVNSTSPPVADAAAGEGARAGGGGALAPGGQLGKNEFLKLLTAQLANQDPTKPLDSQAFVAQLAQFSSLEQQSGTNERLDSLLLAQASASQTSAMTFVGKEILFRTDKVALGPEGGATISAKLASDAANASATITDERGKVVRTIQLGRRAAGAFDVAWDGRDDAGNTLPPGDYKVRVAATDDKQKSVPVEMRRTGLVTGVVFENGYPELVVGGSRIKMSEIVELKQRSGT
jgi:flagellar basal-body rod modification protein FlgD